MERAYLQCIICGATIEESSRPTVPDNDPNNNGDGDENLVDLATFTGEDGPPDSWACDVRGFYIHRNPNSPTLPTCYIATDGRYYGGLDFLDPVFWFPPQSKYQSQVQSTTHPLRPPSDPLLPAANIPLNIIFKPHPPPPIIFRRVDEIAEDIHPLHDVPHGSLPPPPGMQIAPPPLLHGEGYFSHGRCWDIMLEVFATWFGSSDYCGERYHGGCDDGNGNVLLNMLFRLMDTAPHQDVVRGGYGRTLKHMLEFCVQRKTIVMGWLHDLEPAVFGGSGRWVWGKRRGRWWWGLVRWGDPFESLPGEVRERIVGYLLQGGHGKSGWEDFEMLCRASRGFALSPPRPLPLSPLVAPLRTGNLEERRRDIFSNLPYEIILDILERLDFPSVCSLRHASRAVSVIGFPGGFWRARVAREFGAAFSLATNVVERSGNGKGMGEKLDWRQAYALMKYYIVKADSPCRFMNSLRNRQRIWGVCESVVGQVSAMAEAEYVGEEVSKLGSNPIPAPSLTKLGRERQDDGENESEKTLEFATGILTTLNAAEAAGAPLFGRGKAKAGLKRFAWFGDEGKRKVKGVWVSFICIGGRRFVSGLRFVHVDTEGGQAEKVSGVGFVHRKDQHWLPLEDEGRECKVRFAVCDRGIKGIASVLPGCASKMETGTGGSGWGKVRWAGGYDPSMNHGVLPVETGGIRGVSYADITLNSPVEIQATMDILKIRSIEIKSLSPSTTPSTTSPLPFHKRIPAWAPFIPPTHLYNLHLPQYYYPTKTHAHFSPLSLVLFADDPTLGAAKLSCITAYISKRDGLLAMRFDFSLPKQKEGAEEIPSRWWSVGGPKIPLEKGWVNVDGERGEINPIGGIALPFWLDGARGECVVGVDVEYVDMQMQQHISEIRVETSFGRMVVWRTEPAVHFLSKMIVRRLDVCEGEEEDEGKGKERESREDEEESQSEGEDEGEGEGKGRESVKKVKPICGFYGCFYPTRKAQGVWPSLSSFGIVTRKDAEFIIPHSIPTFSTGATTSLIKKRKLKKIAFPTRYRESDIYAPLGARNAYARTQRPYNSAAGFEAAAAHVYARPRPTQGPMGHQSNLRPMIHFNDLERLLGDGGGVVSVKGWVLAQDTGVRMKGQATGLVFWRKRENEQEEEEGGDASAEPIVLGQVYDPTEGGDDARESEGESADNGDGEDRKMEFESQYTKSFDFLEGERVTGLTFYILERGMKGRMYCPINSQLQRVRVETSLGRRFIWGQDLEKRRGGAEEFGRVVEVTVPVGDAAAAAMEESGEPSGEGERISGDEIEVPGDAAKSVCWRWVWDWGEIFDRVWKVPEGELPDEEEASGKGKSKYGFGNWAPQRDVLW